MSFAVVETYYYILNSKIMANLRNIFLYPFGYKMHFSTIVNAVRRIQKATLHSYC